MSEWWTYGLSDFLLFSPRTYYRLIERHNAAVWPAQLAAVGVGLGLLRPLRRPTPAGGRLIAAILAAMWAWVGWAFIWRRYAGINWAATYLAGIFAAQVVLLVWIGVVRGALSFEVRRDQTGVIGIALFVLAVAVYPTFGPLAGRGWPAAEVFGTVPDPTVVGTLGLLLLPAPARLMLTVPPILLCAISGATLWAMGSPEAWLLLAAVVLAGAALRPGSSSRAAPGTAGGSAAAERGRSP
jgi:hypothetical protein